MFFLSIWIVGFSFGNSTTCICATRISVWNLGASSDTSHWNLPVRARFTLRSVTDCASDDWSWEQNYSWKNENSLFSTNAKYFITYINWNARNWKNNWRWRFLWYIAIKFFTIKIPSHGIQCGLKIIYFTVKQNYISKINKRINGNYFYIAQIILTW